MALIIVLAVTSGGIYFFSARGLVRAQEALRRSEERFRGIVETAEKGIATHEPDGTITYVNQRMAVDYLRRRGKYAEPAPPQPELILLDLSMPKKDGWQGLVEIRGCEDLKDIPLVVLTTSMDEEDRVFCEKAGASGYVTKPNSFVELDAAIHDIIKTWIRPLSG